MTQQELMRLSALISDDCLKAHLLSQYAKMSPSQQKSCVKSDSAFLPKTLSFPRHAICTVDSWYVTNCIWLIQTEQLLSEIVRGEATVGLVNKREMGWFFNAPETVQMPDNAVVAVQLEFGVCKAMVGDSYGVRMNIYRKNPDAVLMNPVSCAQILNFIRSE